MNNVDEVETTERAFLLELISRILQLSYATYCNEIIWGSLECEGCEKNWPSQKDHWCMILADDEEEAWYYYYDDATEKLGQNLVWNRAQEVAQMLEIQIHPSWKSYIPELYKLARTTVYLYFYQIRMYADPSSSYTNSIIQVLASSDVNITGRRKTLTKTSSVAYPEKFNCRGQERMETL